MFSEPVVANSPEQTKIIYIRAIYPSILKYTGLVTGKQYVWDGAGAVVAVDSEDAPSLLSKKIGGRSCCGGSGQDGNKVFEIKESQ